jgi:hypothetical protein
LPQHHFEKDDALKFLTDGMQTCGYTTAIIPTGRVNAIEYEAF